MLLRYTCSTAMPCMRRLLFALATALLSLLLLAAAVLSTDFAAGPWALFGLLALPLTLGLPTTLSALLLTAAWPGGPPLWLFALLCLGVGAALQYSAFALLARRRRRA